MPNDDMVYVKHMLDTARKARFSIKGKSCKNFDADGV
jgi:hypothetical protein